MGHGAMAGQSSGTSLQDLSLHRKGVVGLHDTGVLQLPSTLHTPFGHGTLVPVS